MKNSTWPATTRNLINYLAKYKLYNIITFSHNIYALRTITYNITHIKCNICSSNFNWSEIRFSSQLVKRILVIDFLYTLTLYVCLICVHFSFLLFGRYQQTKAKPKQAKENSTKNQATAPELRGARTIWDASRAKSNPENYHPKNASTTTTWAFATKPLAIFFWGL